ncbi:MAG: AmmeMemoRadiSam system protein B [Mariprofundaceae bacterium]|nr:AmmeMemoRadiSam system protein B [Mariprofundaceae bacterium]
MQQNIRPAAVAGMFYPAEATELTGMLDELLSATGISHADSMKALIVPHAGYIYSGATAAIAYAALNRSLIRHVVLLGPVHHIAIHGLALPNEDTFATPLGLIPLDLDGMNKIQQLPQIRMNSMAHEAEHSLEVQLPFLQRTLDAFTLLPLAVGDATSEEIAEVLEAVWGGPETLILVTSDMSHYLPYGEAQRIDQATADAILHLQTPIHHQQACGATPVNGLLRIAAQKSMTCRQLDLCNSGDTAGDKQRVVGYGAFAFYETSGIPDHDHAK